MINILVSLIFLTTATSYADPIIKVRSVNLSIIDSSIPLNRLTTLAELFDYLSIGSFILAWIPTVMLLKTYSVRLGRIKYGLLVTIPLVYFLIPFLSDELGIFDELRLQYGREFNLIYNIFFSPYRQVGGLLFGIVFFITSLKVKRYELKAAVNDLWYRNGTSFWFLRHSWIDLHPIPSVWYYHNLIYGPIILFIINWIICFIKNAC